MPKLSPPVLVCGGIALSALVTISMIGPPAPNLGATVMPVPVEGSAPTATDPTTMRGPVSPEPTGADAPAAGPATVMPPPALNDVGWILVAYQSRYDPDGSFSSTAERIETAHERLVESPDDAAWSRSMEDALRGYLAGLAVENFELESVACRATGCEVQAILLEPELARQMRLLPTSLPLEANPIPTLSMDVSERAPLTDRFGVYLSYRRVDGP